MSRKIIIFFFVIILISGCQSNSIHESVAPSTTNFSDSNVIIPSTIKPNFTSTPPINTVTLISSVTPYRTKVPTTEPKVTETPYIISNIGDIHADGKLWIYAGRSIYWIIDMKTGIVTKTPSPPANCFHTPIFETLKVICIGNENLYLFDLSNNNVQDLSIRNPDRLYMPPWVLNNKYLVYGYLSDDLRKVNIYTYDFATKQEVLISPTNQDSEYYISSDGKRVVSVIDNRIIEILPNNALDLTPVSYDDLIYDPYAIIWSPVGNLLFIGAGDHNVNPYPETNNYFVLNAETGIANKFSFPTDELRNSLLVLFGLQMANILLSVGAKNFVY